LAAEKSPEALAVLTGSAALGGAGAA